MTKFASSDDIREAFLDYFVTRDHRKIQGSSLLPQNDPTLLFVNSGMAPLKPYFTGASRPPHPNLCNVQPCIRTRDIDDVGDRHHLTFFEMLGSWSIGGYFKDRAVELAYGLIVDTFGFPRDKLYVSVYSGNARLGLQPDDETAHAWERVGVAHDHIVYLGEDNFWGPAGETGPCGPCTEMFFDTGDAYGPKYVPGGEFDTKRRYLEVWNAGVFMQLDKRADGSFGRLPFNSVDTGSGLERMALVLQGAQSVYETDLFRELMGGIKERVGSSMPEEACRVIADHTRAVAFILSEGVSPGNEGRSYIPRRLIRKCVALVERAGLRNFDYPGLVDIVVRRFHQHYPLLKQRKKKIVGELLQEIREFERVIGKGLERLDQLSGAKGPFTISGRDAFSLFATYGLPVEIAREFVKEKGGTIDEEGYQAEFQKHQEISRASDKNAGETWVEDGALVTQVLAGRVSEFVGYEVMDADAQVLALIQAGVPVKEATVGAQIDLLASKTPFYAEGGGQIGDRGRIQGANGAQIRVLDTRKLGGAHVHRAEVISGAVREGDAIRLSVDEQGRRATMANHSATHLMHAALREVLGTHVRQAGSLVEAERLRFDFEHPSKVTPEQLRTVERRVNEFIRQDFKREISLTTHAKAVESGALAFFGESYGDEVRMVRFGPASVELCGGTHVSATGEIGLFRILSESSVARGVRRVVAVTGEAAVEYTLEQDQLLKDVGARLKATPRELLERVEQLVKKGDDQRRSDPGAGTEVHVDPRAQTVTLPDGVKLIATRVDAPTEALGKEASRIASDIDGVVVLAGESEGKASIVVAVSKRRGTHYHASRLMNLLTPYIDGRGGGSVYLARGGGTKPGGLDSLFKNAPSRIAEAAKPTS